jgi:hypothetical protein
MVQKLTYEEFINDHDQMKLIFNLIIEYCNQIHFHIDDASERNSVDKMMSLMQVFAIVEKYRDLYYQKLDKPEHYLAVKLKPVHEHYKLYPDEEHPISDRAHLLTDYYWSYFVMFSLSTIYEHYTTYMNMFSYDVDDLADHCDPLLGVYFNKLDKHTTETEVKKILNDGYSNKIIFDFLSE